MSMKSMLTKVALAFAAKKGVEAFRNAGGIEGLRASLAGTNFSRQGRGDMSAGLGARGTADMQDLGHIMNTVKEAGARDGREAGMTQHQSPLQGSLGTLFGGLAAAFGSRPRAQDAAKELNLLFADDDTKSDSAERALLRAMVHMARCDGTIDATEQTALLNALQDATPDERAILQEALREPVDAKAIAAETPEKSRREVYAAALLLGEPDVAREHDFLQELAEALGLDRGEVSDLHSAIGKPLLHAV